MQAREELLFPRHVGRDARANRTHSSERAACATSHGGGCLDGVAHEGVQLARHHRLHVARSDLLPRGRQARAHRQLWHRARLFGCTEVESKDRHRCRHGRVHGARHLERARRVGTERGHQRGGHHCGGEGAHDSQTSVHVTTLMPGNETDRPAPLGWP